MIFGCVKKDKKIIVLFESVITAKFYNWISIKNYCSNTHYQKHNSCGSVEAVVHSNNGSSVKCVQWVIELMEFSWSLQTVSLSTDNCTKPGLPAHCAASFLQFLLQLFPCILTSLCGSDFYASLPLICLSRKQYVEQSKVLVWACHKNTDYLRSICLVCTSLTTSTVGFKVAILPKSEVWCCVATAAKVKYPFPQKVPGFSNHFQ